MEIKYLNQNVLLVDAVANKDRKVKVKWVTAQQIKLVPHELRLYVVDAISSINVDVPTETIDSPSTTKEVDLPKTKKLFARLHQMKETTSTLEVTTTDA